jgi:hypothetical protein
MKTLSIFAIVMAVFCGIGCIGTLIFAMTKPEHIPPVIVWSVIGLFFSSWFWIGLHQATYELDKFMKK